MSEDAAHFPTGLSPLVERVLRMQNADTALQLLYARQPLPEQADLQLLRRYLAGEALPAAAQAYCRQLLEKVRRSLA